MSMLADHTTSSSGNPAPAARSESVRSKSQGSCGALGRAEVALGILLRHDGRLDEARGALEEELERLNGVVGSAHAEFRHRLTSPG
jgi:hypothetical protein